MPERDLDFLLHYFHYGTANNNKSQMGTRILNPVLANNLNNVSPKAHYPALYCELTQVLKNLHFVREYFVFVLPAHR